MQSNRGNQESTQHIEHNSRALARGSKRTMVNSSSKAMPVLKIVDGKYQIVDASGVSSRYADIVLLMVHYAHPKSVDVSDLKLWTGYSGITQFKRTVIQKLDNDGRVIFDEDTGEVSITPLGRHFVYERWPILF